MVLQVRITDPDGSNPIILDTAKDRAVSFTINSEDEGGKFSIAKNHPKAEVLNPDTTGYTKFWEVWETNTNERLNYGPITSITEKDTDWVIAGKGRSSLLNDFIDTRKTFYTAIDSFVDSLRFENISIEPRTSTLVHDTTVTADQTTVFGSITVNEKYFGLSKNTKDNVVDNQARFRPGEIEPPNTYYTVESFWAGQSRSDSIIVDLGEVFPISRITVLPPGWGGIVRRANRAYDFSLAYANDTEAPITTLRERDFGPFHELYNTGTNSTDARIREFYLGTTMNGTALEGIPYYVGLDQAGPIDMRYIRVNIANTHAWDGGYPSSDPIVEKWDYQCDPDFVGGASEGIEIDDRSLKPNNNCHAAIIELSAYKEIFGKDLIKPLALQRIDNDNLQITYYHVPDASETTTTDNGYRAFEPGGFFRNFQVSYSGASTTYTKFFSTDCADCYPDGFNFGIVDQNNSLIYASDNASGTNVAIKGSAYTRNLTMRGASNAVITYADAWKSKYDPLSWGASYSFTEEVGDYLRVQFRGQSFKWYATIPDDKTGAEVSIQIRNKATNGTWTGYTTLESSYFLPNDVSSSVVYEITYESESLLADTVYEVKITNLDGGFCSVDSFEGYWSASMSTYNDDSSRAFHYRPESLHQIYDGRFNMGTMTKWNTKNFMQFSFEGDRIIVLSAKGRRHGVATLHLSAQGDSGTQSNPQSYPISIPGGEVDGSLKVNLNTGKRGQEIPQYIMFDSNDYFTSGLKWDAYTLRVSLLSEDRETYFANIYDTNNFIKRCEDCKTPKGTEEIYKYIYLDSFLAHEQVGLSVSFETQTHLEMVKSVAEAIQVEWEVNENGLRFEPRIGRETNEVLREGQNTVVEYEIVNDAGKIASMLFSSGSDIDGLPLSTVTEDRKNRNVLGRTVMKKEDFRETADYLQLIGLGRMELRRRRVPEKRIQVSHSSQTLDLVQGDSFILYTKKQGPLRVRIEHLDITENDGRIYKLECIRWPIVA